MMTVRIDRSVSRRSSPTARSTERFDCPFESKRSPQIEHHVDRALESHVDRALEGTELACALLGRRRPEVLMPRAEMDVGEVQQQRHPVWLALRLTDAQRGPSCG